MERISFILAVIGLGKDAYKVLQPYLKKAVNDSENKVDDVIVTILDYMLIDKE